MKKGLFISALTLGLAATLFVFSDFTYQRQYKGRYTQSSIIERGACGAMEYRILQRNEFGTGNLDYRLVDEARTYARQFNQMKLADASGIIWDERGPDNQGGRTRAFLIDKDNHNRMYAGGVAGGVWVSNNAGQSWNPVDDFMDNIIVSSFCQAANGDIYFGTGEDFAPGSGCENGSSGFEGHGVFRSTDGGQSFQQVESTWGNGSIQNTWIFVQAMAADPTNPNRIYAATKRGLQVSDDAGETWFNPVKNVGGSDNLSSSQDVVVASDGTVLCSVGNRCYISPNGNDGTFELKSGSGEGELPGCARLKLAISPTDPNYMYAGCASNQGMLTGIYQSVDKGQTWELIGPPGSSFFQPYGTQGTYDNALGVDGNDPNKILVGGLNVWKWKTGGTWTELTQWNFSQLSPNYVHADVHSFTYHPTQPNRVFVTSDGGVGYSSDGGETWTEFNRGYITTQFYTIAAATSDIAIGGMQDNGTMAVGIPGNTEKTGIVISGGDGAGCAISAIEPINLTPGQESGVVFASSQGGSLRRIPNGGGSGDFFYDDNIADTEGGLTFNSGISPAFINPVALWEGFNNDGTPNDTCFATAFGGSNGGIFITREVLHFDRIPKWFRVTGAISGLPNVMKFSEDGDMLLLGTTSGKLYRVSNLNAGRDSLTASINSSSVVVEWDQIASYSQCITGIDINATDNNKVLITLGSYGNSTFVRYSTNAAGPAGSVTFSSKQGALPKFPFYSCVLDVTKPTRAFVGTEGGVYMTENITSGNPQWVPVFGPENGLANVPVYDMFQQKLGYHVASNYGVIYAGTHGRGIWSTGSLVLGNEEKEKNASSLNLTLYPNPVTGNQASINFTLKQADNVTVNVYDISGALVKKIDLGKKNIGNHNYSINTTELRAGSYFMNIQAGNISKSTKFVVLK